MANGQRRPDASMIRAAIGMAMAELTKKPREHPAIEIEAVELPRDLRHDAEDGQRLERS